MSMTLERLMQVGQEARQIPSDRLAYFDTYRPYTQEELVIVAASLGSDLALIQQDNERLAREVALHHICITDLEDTLMNRGVNETIRLGRINWFIGELKKRLVAGVASHTQHGGK